MLPLLLPGRTATRPDSLLRLSELRLLFAAIALTATVPTSRGDIVWAQRRIVLNPPAGAQEIAAEFSFTNRGTQPVRITDVQSGCGCTATIVDRPIVEPGGIGHIRATFHAGQRQGKQSVALTVATQEPELRTHDLQLEVLLKEYAALVPLARSWRVGEDASEQVFTLKLASGFTFVAVESSNPDFRVEVVDRSAELVQFKVAPRDLWSKRAGTIKARVAQPGQPTVEVTALVVVQ